MSVDQRSNMAYRELELTLLSARDLKNVNLLTSMNVYAVASISGDPMTRQCTPPDPSGGRNPCWNATLRFSVPASAAAAGGGWLHVLLRSERALGDRDVGEVIVPLAELLAGADGPGQQPPRLASYQVHTVHRGEPRGVLNVSYRLGPVVAPLKRGDGDKSPVIAYPVPQQQQPFQPQNGSYYPAAAPQQQFPPQNGYYTAPPPQPFQPQNPAQPYHRPHDAYSPPPPPRHGAGHEEDLSPRKTAGSGHGPTKLCVGPHTQIIVGAPPAPPRSNTIPAKAADESRPKPSYVPPQSNTSLGKLPAKAADESRPKPSYVPPQSNASLGKPDYTRPKSFPQHDKTHHSGPKALQQDTQAGAYDAPNRPNMSPKKQYYPSRHDALPQQQVTQVIREYASTQSTTNIPQDSRPKEEAYVPTRANNTPGKTDHSGPKAALQHERMPTATAR